MFNIDGAATAITQSGDFDMTDVTFNMGVTVSGTAANDGIDFGGSAQDPGGSFPALANLNAMGSGTPVYQGGQRTAATAGSITAQSVRFDATYELGTSGYDLSMGAGEVEAEVVEAAAPVVEASSDEPDDLKKIEGIGPKIASTLADAGVTTFAQLAKMSSDEVKELLKGKVRISNPDTWAEQAELAAAGKWDELQTLQDELQGGRRT